MEVTIAALFTLANQHYILAQVTPRGACDSGPCLNGGQCIDLSYPDGPKLFRCVCQEGFRGLTCNRKYDPCRDEPCQNGGVCTSKGENYHCICPEDFKGKNCSRPVKKEHHPCDDNPCGAHGVCEVVHDAFICECLTGFTGTHCDKPVKDTAKEKAAAKEIPKKDKEKTDWLIQEILLAMFGFLVLLILVLLCICCHCLRVWNRRSELISMQQAKLKSGKEVEPVVGWLEMSNILCWEIVCCCCRSPRTSVLAEDQRCLTDPDNITGVIVPLKEYKEMCCYGNANYRDYGVARSAPSPRERPDMHYENFTPSWQRSARYTPLRPVYKSPSSVRHSKRCSPPCSTSRTRPLSQREYPSLDDNRYEQRYEPLGGRARDIIMSTDGHVMNGTDDDGYQVDTFIQSPEAGTDPAHFSQDRLTTTSPLAVQSSPCSPTPPVRFSAPVSERSSHTQSTRHQSLMGVRSEKNMSANGKLSRGEIHARGSEDGAARRLASSAQSPLSYGSPGGQRVRRGDLPGAKISAQTKSSSQSERFSATVSDFKVASNLSENRPLSQPAMFPSNMPCNLQSAPPQLYGSMPFANPSPLQPTSAYTWPPYAHPPYSTPQTVIMYPPQPAQATVCSLSDSQATKPISPTAAAPRRGLHQDDEGKQSRRSSSESESGHSPRSSSSGTRHRLFRANRDKEKHANRASNNENNAVREDDRDSDKTSDSENELERDYEEGFADDGYASTSRFSESDASDLYRDLQSFQIYLAQANKSHKDRVRRQELDSQRRKKTSPRFRSGDSSQHHGAELGDARSSRSHDHSSSDESGSDKDCQLQRSKNCVGVRNKSRDSHNPQQPQDKEGRVNGGAVCDVWGSYRDRNSPRKPGASPRHNNASQASGSSSTPKKIKGILKKPSSATLTEPCNGRLDMASSNNKNYFPRDDSGDDDDDNEGYRLRGSTTGAVKSLSRLVPQAKSPRHLRQQFQLTPVVKHCPQQKGNRDSHR